MSKEQDGYTALQLTFSTDGLGNKLTPVFTDIEALRKFDPNTPCLSVHVRAFFEIIVDYFGDVQAVVINAVDFICKMIRPAPAHDRPEHLATPRY